MEWLKTILEGTQNAAELEDKISKELPKHFKPAKLFNETNDKLKEAEANLTEANNLIEDLKATMDGLSKSTEDIEKVKQQAKEAVEAAEQAKKDALKNAEEAVRVERVKSALMTGLLAADADPGNVDLLMQEFDMNSLTLNDKGAIIGVSEIIAPIKEKRSALFVKKSVEGADPKDNQGNPATNNPFKKETFNLTEQARLLREEPEKAAQLKRAAGN